MRHPKGYIEPVHYHTTAGHYIYMLEGRMRFEGVEAKADDFVYTLPYHAHGPLEMLEETALRAFRALERCDSTIAEPS